MFPKIGKPRLPPPPRYRSGLHTNESSAGIHAPQFDIAERTDRGELRGSDAVRLNKRLRAGRALHRQFRGNDRSGSLPVCHHSKSRDIRFPERVLSTPRVPISQ